MKLGKNMTVTMKTALEILENKDVPKFNLNDPVNNTNIFNKKINKETEKDNLKENLTEPGKILTKMNKDILQNKEWGKLGALLGGPEKTIGTMPEKKSVFR